MATPQEIITAIDAAILERISGTNTFKRIRKNSEELDNYSLDELRRMRDSYMSEASASNGSARNYVKF